MRYPDADWRIKYINKERDLCGTILKKLAGFNEHNDRDEIDCCQTCYFIKILNDKHLCFSENDKQVILQALEILTTWFIRNSFYAKDMEEAKNLFQDFDFSRLFIFDKSIQSKIRSCTIL